MPYEVPVSGGYTVTDDPSALDLPVVHDILANVAYWSRGRADPEITRRSFANSLSFAVRAPDGAMAGFCRLVTDRAVSAHLADVFILPAHRGQGLGKALVAAVLAHPDLVTVRRWSLNTDDAHGLYAQFGFVVHPRPESFMTRVTA